MFICTVKLFSIHGRSLLKMLLEQYAIGLLMHVCNNVMVNQRFVNNMAKNMIDTSALVFIQVIEDTLNNYSS